VKKSVAIGMLIVFLFNVGGYYFIFWGLRIHADQVLNARIDAELYADYETVELKIPVTLPYPPQQQEFTRSKGKFEHNGQHYQVVKHKLENDTLYMVCIKDQQEKELVAAMSDYAKLANDLPASSKGAMNFLGKLTKDFESSDALKFLQQSGWVREICQTSQPFETLEMTSSIASPPPEV
jgi:hypothetical protein